MTDAPNSSMGPELAAIRERTRARPWYRRPRRLRRQVAGTLVLTALVAVALFGGLSYVASDRLLREGATDQLDSVAATRAVRIEQGIERVLTQVATLAADRGVADALVDLTEGLADVDETLTAAQNARLDEFYRDTVIEPVNATGLVSITPEQLEPGSAAARWVQYHHVLPDTDPVDDTTAYADALAEHDPFLQAVTETSGFVDDLLLVSADTGDVVYSTARRIHLATNVSTGPYADSVMGRLVRDDLGRVRAGRGVISDVELYLPNAAQPTLFAAAAVRAGTAIVGAIAIEIPGSALDAITTSNFDWDRMGLDDGESYVVSADDLVLQSVSRAWLDDPDGYLDRIDDDGLRAAIELAGSPAGLQVIDTEPVQAVLDGEEFSGRTENHLGEETYSSSTAIDVAGVDWIVVTDVPVSQAREPVDAFVGRMLLVAAIVVPLAALIGVVIARRLSRPIGPAVDAARAVAEGERRLSLPAPTNDEFGDLGRRLTRMAAALERQETALSEEYERKRKMMVSVLPPNLVDATGEVADTGDVVDTATAVSITVDTDQLDLDADELAELLEYLSTTSARLLAEHGLQRIRVAADRGLYIAGLGDDDHGAETALAFVHRVRDEMSRLRDERGIVAPLHIGVATGPVATGVVGTENLTFGAWGEPVRRALAISALSTADEALIDTSTHRELSDTAGLVTVEGLIDLDGQPMEVYSLAVPSVSGDG